MLERDLVAEVLTAARRKGGDFAEVFVEERSSTSIRLDDGKVEELTTGLDRGAGVRVTQGTTYGYAYSNRLDRDALLEAAAAASAALRGDAAGRVVDLTDRPGAGTNRAERPAGAGTESSIVTARSAARCAVTSGGWAARNSTPAHAAGPSQPVWITSPRFATTWATSRILGRSSSIQRPSLAAIILRWSESK